ncbi:MAG: MATE family efflux transporter [Clostridia bacterium]|nr:MATE family efflux transporter [Clostridia bacterium]
MHTRPSSRAALPVTEGPILRRMMLLAAPMMGSQALQMLYNLTDMFWLGRLGSEEVAATGAAGLYLWLSVAFMLLASSGASIGVSQSLGAGRIEKAKNYTQTAVFISLTLGVIVALLMFFFRYPMADFFRFQEQNVTSLTVDYLAIAVTAMPVTYLTATLTAVFIASGNSRTPFLCNMVGMIINMTLDPLFIFTFRMGVPGAAYATIIGQMVVCIILAIAIKKGKNRPFDTLKLIAVPSRQDVQWILKKTIPIGAESFLFTILVMITSRREAFFGADAVAMSRVGSQIESLTWLVGSAFGSALITFIGQNYGAQKWRRILKSYKTATWAMFGYGAFVTLLLAVPGKYIFGLFLPDPALIERSVPYLRILAICQIPLCMEAVASNTFRGLGKTTTPAVINTVCNIIRVPLVYLLSGGALGLSGVWIGITACACLKGVWSYTQYYFTQHRKMKHKLEETNANLASTG